MTKEDFIERAIAVNGDKFDYSKVEFVNMNTRVLIKCLEHNIEFMQFPINHLRGCGCVKCKGDKISKIKTSNTEEFIRKAKQIHGDKYDYTKVKYKDNRTPVTIICSKHDEFKQTPQIHLKGSGCPYCKYELNAIKCTLTTKEFIARAERVHGKGMFDYSEVKYVNTHVPVTIKCRYGHRFETKPCEHIHKGSGGCPICNHSKGEYVIMKYLEEHNIEYVTEYKIIPIEKALFGRKYFRADFYLPKFNTIIEFHGEQHYRPCSIWNNSIEKFEEQQDRDNRLRKYCKHYGISLIEIPYTKYKSINRILSHKLNGFN